MGDWVFSGARGAYGAEVPRGENIREAKRDNPRPNLIMVQSILNPV